MASDESAVPATTEAAAAGAATRTGQLTRPDDETHDVPCAGINQQFTIGHRVRSYPDRMVYERKRGDPVYRPLRIYTLDPSVPRGEGGVATVNVPYEPLDVGPKGAVFEVDSTGPNDEKYTSVDLEHPMVLIRLGKDPSPTDAEFHQQMVYAVSTLVYYTFRKALGRDVNWSFARPGATRLRLQPHRLAIDNAYYDAGEGAILFGHSRAGDHASPNNLPHSIVFTALSHDIVAHEVTHALIDGLRAHFTIPTGPDVLALHEGLADAVAVFQHFSYEPVLENAIHRRGRDFDRDELLSGLAQEFGFMMRQGGPLRTAIDVESPMQTPPQYADAVGEEHRLGSVLLSAIFEAFSVVFRRKTERYINLATAESGELPSGNLPSTLRDVLAQQASKLASQFLSICVRAIDYCPPVDVTFGEYLRALITADYDLVPDDKWRYREALIRAFRRRGVEVADVPNLSEEALLWKGPRLRIDRATGLSFAQLRFAGDPGRPASPRELFRQGCVLGQLVSRAGYMSEFGLAPTRQNDGEVIEPPQVESVRTSRRVGPDGQIAFDLVAEVTQRRHVIRDGVSIPFYGGSTIILDPNGDIRYVISKSVMNEKRLADQLDYIRSDNGRLHWTQHGQRLTSEPIPFKLVHAHKRNSGE